MANPEFEDVVSLEGVAPTKNKSVPVIAIATTAGTAAETTINYVITDTEKKRKIRLCRCSRYSSCCDYRSRNDVKYAKGLNSKYWS